MRGLVTLIFLCSLAGFAASFLLFTVQYDPQLVPAWIPKGFTSFQGGENAGLITILNIPVELFAGAVFLWCALISGLLLVSGHISSVYAIVLSAVSWVLFGAELPFVVMRILNFGISRVCVILIASTFIMACVSIVIVKLEKRRDPLFLDKVMKTVRSLRKDSGERFVFSLNLVVAAACIAFCAMSAVTLDLYDDFSRSKQREIRMQSAEFLNQKISFPSYPDTPLMIGKKSARVKIAVFSDPFCPACISFYSLEEKLRIKFGDEISVYHYMFPLDSSCNDSIKTSSFPLSCEASHYFFAAAMTGKFDSIIKTQGSDSEYIHEIFQKKSTPAEKYSSFFTDKRGAEDFIGFVTSKAADERIKADIGIAKRLSIRKTPTIYINGKRVDVHASYEFLTTVIAMELRK